MPIIAGQINIIKMIRIVSFLASVLEYGFQNKKIVHKIMHPTEASTPNREYFNKDLLFNSYLLVQQHKV
jgi:hypothetical protein